MEYRYRWWYVCCIVIIVGSLGYSYVLQAPVNDLLKLRDKEKSLRYTLEKIKKFAEQHQASEPILAAEKFPQQTQMDVLRELLIMAHGQGLTVNTVETVSAQQFVFGDAQLFHITAQADFLHFQAFIQALSAQSRPLLLTDFNYQVTAAGVVRLDMYILAIKTGVQAVTVQQIVNDKQRNPFCFVAGQANLVPGNDASMLQSYPLQQMRYVGYVQRGENVIAIMSLPNGRSIDVGVGMVVGVQKGVVLAIRGDLIEVVVGKEKKFISRAP